MRDPEDRLPLEAECPLALQHVRADTVVVLRRGHRALELGELAHLAEEGVGVQQDVVVEDDVVDAHHAVLAQLHVVHERRAAMQRHSEPEVGVVIEVGARGHHPVHEAGLHQRDDGGHPEPRRREGARKAHPDRAVRLEHLPGEEQTAVPEPAGVEGQERLVHQVGNGEVAVHGRRADRLPPQVRRATRGHDPTSPVRSSRRSPTASPGRASPPPPPPPGRPSP